MSKIYIIFILSIFILKSYAQESHIYENKLYSENIKTLQVYKEGWELSYPVINLNGNSKIVIAFDDLTKDVKDYSYKLIHCNSNWESSEMSEAEYIDGFSDNVLDKYEYSFNTFVEYTHYKITIPNDDFSITKSGNYIVKIYENFNEEELVLTARFIVFESRCDVNATFRKATIVDKMKSHQKIDFKLSSSINIDNPFNDVKVVVVQNNNWQIANKDLKPLFIKDNELEYTYDLENLYPGGSEFRYLNIKSFRYKAEMIDEIKFEKPYHHVNLLKDEPRPFKIYFYNQDINGKFVPDVREWDNAATEADYAYVYFRLPYNAPFLNGDLYLFGGLTYNKTSNESKMVYNFEKKEYQLKLLLKQGVYNYNYAFVDKNKNIDFSIIEGNHYETENDYLIFVYHKGFGDRYEKIIGYTLLNTLNQ